MGEQLDVQHPDLLGLLRGELTNAQVADIGTHLDTCTQCRDELSQVAVGHALLTGASRTLTAPITLEPMTEPAPLDVRRIKRGERSRWTRPAFMLVAAAVLVAGTAGITAQFAPENTQQIASPPPERTATLVPIDSNGTGEVQMAAQVDDHVAMTIETHDLPNLPAGEFYYAWLLDPDTNKMLPLGQIGPSGTATFELPVALISEYAAVDISLEYDDGDPEHSITSVLRAEYT